MAIGLEPRSINLKADEVLRNAPPALLYEHAIAREGAAILSGALATFSGEKTGRSPKDKRIVERSRKLGPCWWGQRQHPRERPELPGLPAAGHRLSQWAADGLRRRRLRGMGPRSTDQGPRDLRPGVSRPVHAQPLDPPDTPTSWQVFGEPDFVILNAGDQAADRRHSGRRLRDQPHAQPRARRDGHPGDQLRRRDEKGRLHRDELLDAQARRALDALQRQPGTGR